MLFKQSEGTAARRRFFLYLVDATDGITAETGEATGQPQFSKNGAAWGNTAATLTAVGNGTYYVELSAAELDTLGTVAVRYKSANTAEFSDWANVVAYDMHDTVRLGLTALPNAAAEAAGGLYTRGTGAGQINQAANGMIDTNPVRLNNVSQSLLDLKDFADDGYDPSTNKVQGVVLTDTVTTYTGNTPQTGDAFARLGAPAGASVSADIAAIEAQTDDIGTAGAGLTAVPWNAAWDAEVQSEVADALGVYDPPTHAEVVSEINDVQTDIAAVQTKLGVPAGVSLSADIAEIEAQTDDIGTAGAGLTAVGWNAAWDAEVQSEVADALTAFGAATAAAVAGVQSDTDAIQVVLGSPAGASLAADIAAIEAQTDDIGTAGAGLTAVPWNAAWDAEVQSEVADALNAYDPPTHAELTTATANLDAAVSTRATPAQVNTEVVDVLTVDTAAELAAVPAATSSIRDRIAFLFFGLRNKVTQTEDTQAIRNSGDTADIASASLSDDGTTFVRGRFT